MSRASPPASRRAPLTTIRRGRTAAPAWSCSASRPSGARQSASLARRAPSRRRPPRAARPVSRLTGSRSRIRRPPSAKAGPAESKAGPSDPGPTDSCATRTRSRVRRGRGRSVTLAGPSALTERPYGAKAPPAKAIARPPSTGQPRRPRPVATKLPRARMRIGRRSDILLRTGRGCGWKPDAASGPSSRRGPGRLCSSRRRCSRLRRFCLPAARGSFGPSPAKTKLRIAADRTALQRPALDFGGGIADRGHEETGFPRFRPVGSGGKRTVR